MRFVFRILAALILLLVLLGASLFFLPGERIARIAEDQLSAQTGRRVTIGSGAKVSFYPVLGVRTGEISIANADWSNQGPMLSAESLKVGVDVMALIGGEIRITGLDVVKPVILLEQAADGRVNWSSANPAAAGSSNTLALSLDRALISGAQLRYLDHQSGSEWSLSDVDLDLRWPDYRGAADFNLVLRPAAEDVTISGEVVDFAGFLSGGLSAVNLKMAAQSGQASFQGRAGLAPEAVGRLSLKTTDINSFLAALGVEGGLPDAFGGASDLEGDVTLIREGQISLRGAKLALGGYALAGDADLRLGERPYVTANLATGDIDLNSLMGAEEAGNDTGWSQSPIDASALALFDGEIALAANSLRAAGLSFGKARIRVALDRARAVFTLRELEGYSGGFGGEFVMNNRNGLSVGGALTARGIEASALLGDIAGVTRLGGRFDGEVNFLGIGNTMAKIMNSLEGDGTLRMATGVIAGFDLARLLRAENARGGTTPFEDLNARFTIREGDLLNSDLSLAMEGVSATGKGRIGLGQRDIDYLFTPVALEARGGRGLAVPVRLRGPWADPKITADINAAIDLNLAEEKRQAREKLRQEVDETVQKELGVSVEEGQTLEEAVKEKVGKEAVKGLLKLLE